MSRTNINMLSDHRVRFSEKTKPIIARRTLRHHSSGPLPRRVIASTLLSPSFPKREQVDIKIHLSPLTEEHPTSASFSRSISFRLNSSSSPVTVTNDLDSQFKSEIYYNGQLTKKITQLAPKLHVDLSRWHLIDQDIPIIIKDIILAQKCTELWLYNNELTAHGASLLALGLINNSSLTSLDLSFNHISDLGVWALTQVLLPDRCSSIRILFLSKNGITDQGVIYLAEMLKTNQTVTELWLSNNEISNQGVKHLSTALIDHNRTLKFLSLSMNQLITDLCLDGVISMLEKNPTLKKLWIKDCHLSDTGKTRLKTHSQEKRKAIIEL